MITVRVMGGPAFATLKVAQHDAGHLRQVLDGPIANRVHAVYAEQFKTAGRYGGDDWPELAPFTLKAKARIGRAGMGILRRYNTLWSSLTKRSSPLGYRIATDKELIVGTSVSYAAKHETGMAGPPRLPKRKIVPSEIPLAEKERWATLIAKHLAKEK